MTRVSFVQEAWSNLGDRTSSLVPVLLATAVLVFFGWLASLLIARLTWRFLDRIHLDRLLENGTLPESLVPRELGRSPARLIARVVYWLLLSCVLVVGLENLGLDLSDLPIRSFIAYLPMVLGAVLLLVAGVALAAFLSKGTQVALDRMGVDSARGLGKLVRGLVLALTAVLVIEQLGFSVTALTATFSNLILVIAAGLVFAFAWGSREVARNVVAGLYVREQFRQGDRLVVDGHEGTLEEVGSLNCRLARGDDSGEIIVPNSLLIDRTVQRTADSDIDS